MSRDGKVMDEKKVPTGALAPGQRWSVARERDVVMRLLRGEPLDQVSREVSVEIARLERWKERALAAMDEGLRERGDSPVERELEEAKARIGDALHGERAAQEARGEGQAFSQAEVAQVSGETSASTGKLYGIERVCRVGGLARATFYAPRSRAAAVAARVEGTVEGPAQLARARTPASSHGTDVIDRRLGR
jgi:transposase